MRLTELLYGYAHRQRCFIYRLWMNIARLNCYQLAACGQTISRGKLEGLCLRITKISHLDVLRSVTRRWMSPSEEGYWVIVLGYISVTDADKFKRKRTKFTIGWRFTTLLFFFFFLLRLWIISRRRRSEEKGDIQSKLGGRRREGKEREKSYLSPCSAYSPIRQAVDAGRTQREISCKSEICITFFFVLFS
jgi:hypothetical protein